jgi:hypothetical protein
MKRLNRPWVAVLVIVLILVALWGASALWHWTGYGYHYGMMGWGLTTFNWPGFMVMGLWHLLFWGVLTAGIIWLVQTTDRQAKPTPEEEG